MNFSQRMGLEPARSIQKDSMDEELRNSLWNAFDGLVLEYQRIQRAPGGPYVYTKEPINGALFVSLWVNFFKWPLSTLPEYAVEAEEIVHKWFFNTKKTPWNWVYEFIEFVADLKKPLDKASDQFRLYCNRILERECSAYRFVGKILTPLTSEAEIAAIERATAEEGILRPVSMHIEAGLKLLSDKQNPDYRNSMKESISAVESVCKLITNLDKATLGQALDTLTATTNLHPRLRDAFKALYGYTNDDHGIRHGLKDDNLPEQEDAKFFLVACSAFINYLTEKARKAGQLP